MESSLLNAHSIAAAASAAMSFSSATQSASSSQTLFARNDTSSSAAGAGSAGGGGDIELTAFSYVAIAIFLLVIVFTLMPVEVVVPFTRRRWRFMFDFAWAPVAGVVLLLATRCIGWEQVKLGIVGGESAQPYAILILFFSVSYLAISLDVSGILGFLSLHIVKRAGTSGYRLYFFIYLLAAIITLVTSNDIVILTLTPIVLQVAVTVRADPIPFLIAEYMSANVWSVMLYISNTTNVIVASSFNWSFTGFSVWMTVPTLAGGIACYLMLLVVFRGRIPTRITIPDIDPKSALNDFSAGVFGCIWFGMCVVALIATSFVNIPVWQVTLPFGVGMFLRDLISDLVKFYRAQKSGDSKQDQQQEQGSDAIELVSVEDGLPSFSTVVSNDNLTQLVGSSDGVAAASHRNAATTTNMIPHFEEAPSFLATHVVHYPNEFSFTADAVTPSGADEASAAASSSQNDRTCHTAAPSGDSKQIGSLDTDTTTIILNDLVRSDQHGQCEPTQSGPSDQPFTSQQTHEISSVQITAESSNDQPSISHPTHEISSVQITAESSNEQQQQQQHRDQQNKQPPPYSPPSASFIGSSGSSDFRTQSPLPMSTAASAAARDCAETIELRLRSGSVSASGREVKGAASDWALDVKRAIPTVWAVVSSLPWTTLPFLFGMFTMVEGLASLGWTSLLARGLSSVSGDNQMAAVVIVGFVAALACIALSNQPMTILFNRSLTGPGWIASEMTRKSGLLGLIVASNLGCNLSLTGALAGLLWATLLKEKKITVPFMQFLKYGFIILPVSLAASLGVLVLEFIILGDKYL